MEMDKKKSLDEKQREALALPPQEECYGEKLGFPGAYPFTRGVYPTMYAGKPWTMRQYGGFGTAEETNRRFKYLLEQGQTGLSVAFDLPTQMGYDSDDPMSRGEVGKAGVAIDTLEDMQNLLDGIPLEKVSISMTINATAPILLALLIAVGERRGIEPRALSGTVQNDILKEFIARGCYAFPPQPSLKLAMDVFEYCLKTMPKWNFISVSGYHIREAGATAAQEVGFTFANGIAYLEEARKRRLDLNAVGQRLSFFFNAHNNFLEEVAKFRAARRLWARIMKERFGVTDERAQLLRFHTQTAGSALTAQQVENNVVRVTFQALEAVLGGTQSLHTNAMDEALALPTDQAAKLALRTQQIIGYESGVTDVVDPLGGSYYIEGLTDKLEREALRYIEAVDKMGGALGALERQYYQREIERSALEHQHRIESGEKIVVGVNKFQESEVKKETPLMKVDPRLEEEQIRRLQKIRRERPMSTVEKSLAKLKKAAGENENLMPYILGCVCSKVTLGEICSELRKVYGIYRSASAP